MSLESKKEMLPMQESEPTFSQLGKQNSILNLTIDEFQSKSGKNFGSMNMDEFIASIWSSEDNQLNSPQPAHDKAAEAQSKNVAIATEHTISQQGAMYVPPPICKKTVDEVWYEIQQTLPQRNEANNNLGRNETLGEITLEDFLIKTGVVQESSSLLNSTPQLRTEMPFQNQIGNAAANTPFNASYGLRPAMGMRFSTQHNIGTSVSYQMLSQNNSLVVRDPTRSHAVEPESSGFSNSKRIIDGPPEVVLERRQRRMLKNRESAARSRARRQAYTVELEAELNLLKQENDELKRILAEAERKRRQEILQRKHSTAAQKRTEKLRAIRRPISTSW